MRASVQGFSSPPLRPPPPRRPASQPSRRVHPRPDPSRAPASLSLSLSVCLSLSLPLSLPLTPTLSGPPRLLPLNSRSTAGLTRMRAITSLRRAALTRPAVSPQGWERPGEALSGPFKWRGRSLRAGEHSSKTNAFETELSQHRDELSQHRDVITAPSRTYHSTVTDLPCSELRAG